MRRSTIELLRSPDTGNVLRCTEYRSEGDRVVEAVLFDDDAGQWFRIEDEIADLSPLPLRNADADAAFAARHGLAHSAGEGTPPDANAVEQRRFFGEEFERYEQEVVESPFYKVLDDSTLGRWVRGTLKGPQLIAELGAGSGRQTQILAGAGHDVVALDLSPEMLRVAQGKLRKLGLYDRVDLVVGVGEAPPLANGAFDTWVIMGSLHHFSDPAEAVEMSCRLLKPGGRFFLLEPHRSPVRPIFDWLMRRSQLWHEEANEDPLFTFEKFRDWLGRAGADPRISTSTFLPPHLFYWLPAGLGGAVLTGTDSVFGNIPGVQRFGGVIIATGRLRAG